MKQIRTFLREHREIISYFFWGGMTMLVSWGTYSLFMALLQSVAVANALSWICAVLFAFVTNKLWVFRSRKWSLPVILPEVGKFFASRLAAGFLEIETIDLGNTAQS